MRKHHPVGPYCRHVPRGPYGGPGGGEVSYERGTPVGWQEFEVRKGKQRRIYSSLRQFSPLPTHCVIHPPPNVLRTILSTLFPLIADYLRIEVQRGGG